MSVAGKWGWLFGAGLMCWAWTAPAQGAGGGWRALTGWVGKYPAGRGASSLVATEPVRSVLMAVATARERGRLARYSVVTPVQAIGGDLVADYCKPHDCGAESAALVIDPERRMVWLGFYSTARRSYRADWVGNADPALVPEAVLAALAARHSPF